MGFIDRLRKEAQEQKPTKELEQMLENPGITPQDKHAARTVLVERRDRR